MILTKRGRPMVVVQPWEECEIPKAERLGITLQEDWK